MLAAYYRFEVLPDDVKAKHKIRSKARLDCTVHSNPTGYKVLIDFINHKGQMYLFRIPANGFIKANTRRLAEWSLTNGSLNLSSIYIEDTDFPEYGYGYPNANRLKSNGDANPLFLYRNDCYLFLTNKDLSLIEVLVIAEGRNLVGAYYQRLIDVKLDQEIEQLREQAQPFFDYGNAL
ncbi:hypothetical protein ACFS7Z_13915 [Pontibacter toksunensis]|uniref:Uncharacterized protein n=1 Tax=Pontibacter toksunensis TaxID=1332631 RepID=A0ABW6BX05_9BACT